MSVNLDGYNIPRGSTLKSNLEKRVEKLEESMLKLATLLEKEAKQSTNMETNNDNNL